MKSIEKPLISFEYDSACKKKKCCKKYKKNGDFCKKCPKA